MHGCNSLLTAYEEDLGVLGLYEDASTTQKTSCLKKTFQIYRGSGILEEKGPKRY